VKKTKKKSKKSAVAKEKERLAHLMKAELVRNVLQAESEAANFLRRELDKVHPPIKKNKKKLKP